MDETEVIGELESDRLSRRRRRALLSELQRVGTERSIDVLEQSLHSSDAKSQVAAVSALRMIGTDQAVNVLAQCLRMEMGPRFTFAIKALADLRTMRAVPALIETLDTRRAELKDGDKWLLIYALIQTPHRSEVPVLAATLRERHRKTRRSAANALAQIRTPESEAALEDAVKSLPWLQRPSVRRALHWQRNVAGG